MRKNMRSVLVFCAVLLIAAALLVPIHAFASAPGRLIVSHSPRLVSLHGASLLAIGDSLTVGWGATQQDRDYLTYLQQWTGVRLLPNVAHYGVNVPTTLAELQQTPPPVADVYLIELGTNDGSDDPVVFA